MAAGSNVVTNWNLVGSTDPMRDILRSTENRLNLLESAYRGNARLGPGVLGVATVADLPDGVVSGTLAFVLADDSIYTMQPGDVWTLGGVIPGYP